MVKDKQIAAVLSLDGEGRYAHFIKIAADSEVVWGLFQDGWAMAYTDEGRSVFPLWPTKEYADLCANDEWQRYKPEPINLKDLLDHLLPKLKRENASVGVFFVPNGRGVTPSIDMFRNDLVDELNKY